MALCAAYIYIWHIACASTFTHHTAYDDRNNTSFSISHTSKGIRTSTLVSVVEGASHHTYKYTGPANLQELKAVVHDQRPDSTFLLSSKQASETKILFGE